MKKFRHLFLLVSAMLFISSITINAQGPIDPTLNLAAGKFSEATSGNAATLGNDGNPGTRWESEHQVDPQYFYIDLGADYVINKFHILWEGAYAKHYKIQAALELPTDPFGDEGWTEIYDEADKPNADPSSGFFTTPTPARYVRLQGIERGNTAYGYSFWEFSIYGIAEYDASGIDALTYLAVTPTTVEMSANSDELKFEAYPITGKGLLAENVTLEWSCTGTATDIDAATGLYRPTTGGEQTITCTATPSVGDPMEGTATVNVTAPRQLATININFPYSVYGVNEVATYTVETFDQYGDPFAATLTADATSGLADHGAKTYIASEKGTHTITLSDGNGISKSATLTIIDPLMAPADFTATSTFDGIDNSASSNPKGAVDGNLGSVWGTATTDVRATPAELIIDMGATYDLSMIRVIWEGACAKDYTVEVATTAAGPYVSVGGENRGEGVNAHFYETPSLTNKGIQFIKINCTTAATQYGYKIYEVQAFGVSGTVGINTNSVDGMNVYCVNKTLNIKGDDIVSANVYSLQGKLVLSVSNTNTVDVSSLADGLYIVNVKDINGNTKAVKVQVK